MFMLLINIFYLFFATSGIGVILADRFVLSLPIVALIGIDILLILMLITKQSKLRKKTLFCTFLFIIWSVIVTVTRYDISSFVLSISGLILMWIPFVIKIPLSDKITYLTLSKLYFRGLIFSFIGAYQDIFSALFSLPKTEEIIPFAATQSIGDLSGSLNIGIDRINSLMTEPSEYAAFLVFGYICLDYLESQKSVSAKTALIVRIHIIIFLLFTFSISGLILFASYWIISILLQFFRKNGVKSLLRNIATWLAIGITIFIITKLIPDLEVASIAFIQRIEFLSNTSSNLNRSEGSRINSINLALDSLRDNYGFIGQGYGKNTSNWILENYGGKSIHYARGDIFNTYAAVTIAVGIPGLLFFIVTIYHASINYENNNVYRIELLLIWLMLGFFLGSLLWYSYWGILYLVAVQGIPDKHNLKNLARDDQ